MSEFVADLKKIKERARNHMQQGAVTENYKGGAANWDADFGDTRAAGE